MNKRSVSDSRSRTFEYLFNRHDLRNWHYDFDGIRSGDRHKHGGAFTDSPALTHCICYGAAHKAVRPLLEELDDLRLLIRKFGSDDLRARLAAYDEVRADG
jgi:hypothetical protein